MNDSSYELKTDRTGDFSDLLHRTGYRPFTTTATADGGKPAIPQGTTVFAFHFKDGVIVAGDRRATAGNAIMYERCDKVIPIDDYSLMAIAGVPATAFEMARVLSHNFEYYRRSQLQSMSAEGKIRALSRLLKENVGMAMQGVGIVSPIFATFDLQVNKPFIYFYDIMGAQFQILTHTATGSGSPIIRGILEHEDLWGVKPLDKRDRNEAAILAIRLLQTAAQFDSATGHARPEENIYPIIAQITGDGYEFIPEGEMPELYRQSMKKPTHV
jgi:proteasome beta subunit